MSEGAGPRPRLLVVGGCGGLIGRAVLEEFGKDWSIRSVHRHAVPEESRRGVEWIAADVGAVEDWSPWLVGVDTVVTLAWYRQARARRFERLAGGLRRLVRDAERASVRRFVHVSVPSAPAHLEERLPYLARKRDVDRALAASSLAYTIVRPTMLFGHGDRLATVMMRTMARYHRFPEFGKAEYHLSPVSTSDVARVLRLEAETGARRTVDVGGPYRWRYRELTDRMFAAVGRPPKYFRLSEANSVRLARFLEAVGSSLLYAYEAEWLLSDMLGLPPYEGLGRPLEPIEPFLDREGMRWRWGARKGRFAAG